MLVVEDDPGIRALMRKILHRQGFQVLEAAGGEEALELAAGHQGAIQLLITDLMMPQMGGREVSERVLAKRPGVKVLYVSGYTDDPMIQAGQLPEGTAFLQKPFTLGALLDKVRTVLGGWRHRFRSPVHLPAPQLVHRHRENDHRADDGLLQVRRDAQQVAAVG